MTEPDGATSRSRDLLRDALVSLSTREPESLATVGAALEEGFEVVSGGDPTVSDLLMACLEALQAVYAGSCSAAALDEVRGSLMAFLTLPGTDCAAAAERVRLACEVAPAPPEPPTSATVVLGGESGALDMAIALLVPLEADSIDGWEEFIAALGTAGDDPFLAPVRPLLAEAAMVAEPWSSLSTDERAECLDRLNDVLDDAWKAINCSGRRVIAPPSPSGQPSSHHFQSHHERLAPPVPVSVSTPSSQAHSPTAPFAAKPPAKVAEEPVVAEPVARLLPPDVDRGILVEFIVESRDYITEAEAALLQLETTPDDREAVDTIFRAFHTVKSTSAYFGLNEIGEIAHHAESVLNLVRNGAVRYGQGPAELSLRCVDMVKALLDNAQEALDGGLVSAPTGYVALVKALMKATKGDFSRSVEQPSNVQEGSPMQNAGVDAGPPPPVREMPPSRQGETGSSSREGSQDASVRVRTDRLDQLVDMVGEMVIAHSMAAEEATVAIGATGPLAAKMNHLGKMVRELQDLAMSMRMVPLKAIFQKTARVARDVASGLGKTVSFTTSGEDTELDRQMVDVLRDPLVHIVRNAIDHGLEPSADRVAVGKSATGHIHLAAYRQGGHVVVEVRDDGRGLDRGRILKRAVERGLVDSHAVMADHEIDNLIFAPGFSTAETVTDISGRGVGMDVVRHNVEALRGRVEIETTPGHGSTFLIFLPLTLAITDGMLVRVGSERYVVPTQSIHATFRPVATDLSSVCGQAEMVAHRGGMLPVLRLHRVFDTEGAEGDPTRALLMVAGEGRHRCAILVDELLGQQQVVARNLGPALGKRRGVAGCAILGDGRVGLILDVAGFVEMARERAVGQAEPVA